jgi:Kef-type K+ transport system membrane component KefB
MPFIEAILLLLFFSRILGEISERYGQPAMIGEIAAGVFVGPSLLNLIQITPEIKAISDLGVLLLVFLAGMEMDIRELWSAFRGRGAWVGALGFAIPFALGAFAGAAYGYDHTRTLFLGLCTAVTALPVSIRILMDLAKLQTSIGQKIISAAVANDVTSLLILGIILNMKASGGAWEDILGAVGMTAAKAIIFMSCVGLAWQLVSYTTGRVLISRRALEWLLPRLRVKEPLFALVFLFVIAFAGFSEALGMQFVVGAFFGSMLLSYKLLGKANFEAVQKTASSVTMGFLGPIFFAVLGLEFNVHSLSDWRLVSAVLVAAFSGKLLGGYWGGRLAGLSTQESWTLGVGLNGRGIMELVIANIAFSKGFIDGALFTVLVLMAVMTTFLTPILLKRIYRQFPEEQAVVVEA